MPPTIFKATIAHGMLTAGYISAVFGMELPGPGAIYVSQTLNFRAPVRQGDRVVAKVRVMELYPAKRRARFECVCTVGDKVVLEGEAVLMVPARPRPQRRSRSARLVSRLVLQKREEFFDRQSCLFDDPVQCRAFEGLACMHGDR